LTQQPVLVSVKKIIEILRAEGSLTPGDLLEKVEASRKTFYRALNALKESGVVVNKDGMTYWYEALDSKRFKNEYEANQSLIHSQNLASGLKNLLGAVKSYFIEGELMPDPKYEDSALMHLKTGYMPTHKTYLRAESTRDETLKIEREIEEKIKTKLLTSSLPVNYPENIVKMIISDIKEILRGHKPYYVNNIQIQGELVKSGAYTDLIKKEMSDPLQNYMMEEESLASNRKSIEQIVELEHVYFNLRKELASQIEHLIMKVENGTSLNGKCNLCPKDRIDSQSQGLLR